MNISLSVSVAQCPGLVILKAEVFFRTDPWFWMSTKKKLLGLPKKKKKVVVDELDRGSFHRVVGTEGKFRGAESESGEMRARSIQWTFKK